MNRQFIILFLSVVLAILAIKGLWSSGIDVPVVSTTNTDGGTITNSDSTTGTIKNEIKGSGFATGKVTIGPICPVERVDMPCKPTAETYTSREVLAYASDKKTIVSRKHLSADGSYFLTLSPGNYFLQISPAGIGPGEMKAVAIKSGVTSIVNFDVDTGIR